MATLHVYMCVLKNAYTCTCVYKQEHDCPCSHMYVYTHVMYVHVCMSLCYVYMYVPVYKCEHVCASVYSGVHVNACVSMCVHCDTMTPSSNFHSDSVLACSSFCLSTSLHLVLVPFHLRGSLCQPELIICTVSYFSSCIFKTFCVIDYVESTGRVKGFPLPDLSCGWFSVVLTSKQIVTFISHQTGHFLCPLMVQSHLAVMASAKYHLGSLAGMREPGRTLLVCCLLSWLFYAWSV